MNLLIASLAYVQSSHPCKSVAHISKLAIPKEVKIDVTSTLPDGTTFNNVHELKKLLLLEKDKLAEELLKSISSYALGRSIQFSDQTNIDKMLAKLKPSDYPVRSMIKEIAHSEMFQTK